MDDSDRAAEVAPMQDTAESVAARLDPKKVEAISKLQTLEEAHTALDELGKTMDKTKPEFYHYMDQIHTRILQITRANRQDNSDSRWH